MKQEKIIIKKFGPITRADINIKPFMVFIGESGSGKSVILKLLSLLRWIAKKQHHNEFAKILGIEEYYRFDTERILEDSGLKDFITPSTYIKYWGQTEKIIIENGKLNLPIQSFKNKEIFLEKISFITDDRFTVVLLLNNQIRGSALPYHLEKTCKDFEVSFENLKQTGIVDIQTMDFKILRERDRMGRQQFFVENKKAKTQLHYSSSGMKSVSIIEPILTYFSTIYDKKEVFKTFLIALFTKGNFKDPNDFFKKIPNLQKKHFRLNFFIEEPELSLFPNAQKKLVDFFSKVFNETQNIHIAFSTHSPYMLSYLNCLLKAYELSNKKPKEEIEKFVLEKYWLNLKEFGAYKVKDGKVIDIIDKETKLILADEIDEVSEEIGRIFDNLLDLEFE